MSINPRVKGKINEAKVVNLFKSLGYDSSRVPFSGAGREKGDVRVEMPGTRYGSDWYEAKFWYLEVKARKDLFKSIYRFLEPLLKDCAVLRLRVDLNICEISYNPVFLKPFGSSDKTKEMHLSRGGLIPLTIPNRLFAYKKRWLGTCCQLVLIGNHKDPLFINYETTEKSKDSGENIQDSRS